jgi:FkbM family methyltransferase
VEATTLDDLVTQEGIDRIGLLKMDVEGHEPEVVLGGMSRALACQLW